MRADVRRTGKRPRDAYSEAVAKIPKRFKSSEKQSAVVSIFPAFAEIRGSLDRHRSVQHVPVPDPFNIPQELRSTIHGKNVNEEDVNYNERFLLYSRQEGRLLVFSAYSELSTLYNSEYVIGDGTFEMSPDSSYQLYTLHDFGRGEGLPLVWALLPNKTRNTYIELFTAIRDAFTQSSVTLKHHNDVCS